MTFEVFPFMSKKEMELWHEKVHFHPVTQLWPVMNTISGRKVKKVIKPFVHSHSLNNMSKQKQTVFILTV